MTSLELAAHGTDKLQHGYVPLYERHLDPKLEGVLIEIGVNRGGSLRMWEAWMPNALIIGFDIDPSCAEFANPPRVQVIIADATTFDQCQWYADVVVDDGSHNGDDQVAAFRRFWPQLNPDGWYVIEDLETAWHEGFRNGHDVVALFHDALMDTLLADTPTAREGSWGISEMHVYDQILFMRKAEG